jgi:hypothetical protein
MHGLTSALCVSLRAPGAVHAAEGRSDGFPCNEVQLLQYNADACEVQCLRIYSHTAGEVWGLAACPRDSSLFASVHEQTPSSRARHASIWRMTDIGQDVVTTLTSPLEKVASLGSAHTSSIRMLRWGGTASTLATAGDAEVVLWAAAEGFRPQTKIPFPKSLTGTSRGQPTAAAWDNESE